MNLFLLSPASLSVKTVHITNSAHQLLFNCIDLCGFIPPHPPTPKHPPLLSPSSSPPPPLHYPPAPPYTCLHSSYFSPPSYRHIAPVHCILCCFVTPLGVHTYVSTGKEQLAWKPCCRPVRYCLKNKLTGTTETPCMDWQIGSDVVQQRNVLRGGLVLNNAFNWLKNNILWRTCLMNVFVFPSVDFWLDAKCMQVYLLQNSQEHH